MKSLSQSFYSQLPQTAETQFARTASELQSEVSRADTRTAGRPTADSVRECEKFNRPFSVVLQMKYRKAGRQQAGGSLYSVMAETLDTQHAKEVSQIQSQVAIAHAHMTPQEVGLASIYCTMSLLGL